MSADEYHWRFYCAQHGIEDYYENALKAREEAAKHNADSYHFNGVGAKVQRVKK